MRLFLCFLVFIFLYGCKKDKNDTERPTISITAPITNSSYSVFEEVNVHVTVEDNRQLDYVKIDIIDNNNVSIVTPKTFSNLSKEENLSATLPLENIHLNSGSYNIRVIASDGQNTKSEFKEINIQEEPANLENVLFISNQNGNGQLDQLIGNSNIEPIHNFNSQVKILLTNSYNQQILIAQNNPSKLIYLNTSNLQSIQEISIANDQSPDFYHNGYYDQESQNYFITTSEGAILQIDANGQNSSTIFSLPNFRPYQICTSTDYIFVIEKSYNLSIKKLLIYYKFSGELFLNSTLSSDIIDVFPIDNENIILFGNENNEGKVFKFSVINDQIYDITPINGLPVLNSACKINNLRYSFTTNTDIRTIEIYSNSMSTINTWDIGAQEITYEYISNTLYALQGIQLLQIPNTNESFPNTISFLNSYSEISLLYNK